MSIYTHGKAMLLSLCFMSSSLYAGVEIHKFDVQSGMVSYSITGGAQLTKETNLSIHGSAKLRFREWGDIKLEEEHGIVLTTGSIKHKQEIKRLEKQTHDTIFTVDYENEQLLERKKNILMSNQEEVTDGLLQRGQDVVSGYLCKIWIGPGIKKCIYKGVVLKQESHVLGVSYIKVATEAFFDINTSEDKCDIPDYPVQEFGLFKDNIKTHNTKKADNFCKVLKNLSFDLTAQNLNVEKVDLTDKKRQKFINHIGRDIFKKQKALLPQLLNTLKETRFCLQTGENPFEANQCLEHFSRLKEQLGTKEDDYIILWDDKRKETLLDKIEDELIYIQSRIPCVNRAQNITDLSRCMK